VYGGRVETDYTQLQQHSRRCGDSERASEDHRRDELGSIEHRQRKVFAAVGDTRAVVVAARSAGRAARATGHFGRGALLEVGVEKLLAGVLVDRHNLVAARLGAREEVANGEVDLTVVEVVLEDDEAFAVGVVCGEERLKWVPDLCGALLTRRDDDVGRVGREYAGDGPHHGRDVHGLRDDIDAVAVITVRWMEVQWSTPSAFWPLCLD